MNGTNTLIFADINLLLLKQVISFWDKKLYIFKFRLLQCIKHSKNTCVVVLLSKAGNQTKLLKRHSQPRYTGEGVGPALSDATDLNGPP